MNIFPSQPSPNKPVYGRDLESIVQAARPALRGAQQVQANFRYTRAPFRIQSATLVEAGRWKYTGKRQLPRRSKASEDSYVDDGTAPDAMPEMFNDLEERNLNGFSGTTYGNGIIKSHLPSGFTLQPIPAGAVVWAHQVAVDDDGDTVIEWRFSSPNGVTGACP